MPEAERAALVAERRAGLKEIAAELESLGRPVLLEVGAGHGHFLTAYGAAHPGQFCVGVDLSRDRVERAERKRGRAALANVRFVHADADDFLAVLPASVRFAAVYLLFPDPWPKRRHHKFRLMQPVFLRRLAERAASGARLYFRTDHADYFAAAQKALAGSSAWEATEEPWPFEHETVFQARARSHYSLVERVVPNALFVAAAG